MRAGFLDSLYGLIVVAFASLSVACFDTSWVHSLVSHQPEVCKLLFILCHCTQAHYWKINLVLNTFFFLSFPSAVSCVSVGGGARAAHLPAHLHQPVEPDADRQPPTPQQQHTGAHPQRDGFSSQLLSDRVRPQDLPYINDSTKL